MNLQDFGATIEESEMTEDAGVVQLFMDSFKRKTKFHKSLFEHSFTQRINPISMVNFKDHETSKFLEFNLSSQDLLTDMHSLTAHTKCRILELKDGTLTNLDDQVMIGTIPNSIVSNIVKNFRLFLFDTQISTEKTDRYSLISYVTQYFNAQMTQADHWNPITGFYIDQSKSDTLITSSAQNCSEAMFEKGVISKGYFESGENFQNSVSHLFCERLNSPFLYSSPNLLLPEVSLRVDSLSYNSSFEALRSRVEAWIRGSGLGVT